MKAKSHLPSTLGLTTSDAYTMAWVSLVPTRDLSKPAWPIALDYVRSHQLEDGGWGDSKIYHAHDRVMSTLAAVWALAEWRLDPKDEQRMVRGMDALERYAKDLQQEPYETIGFELILPRLVHALAQLGISGPASSLLHVADDTTNKLARVGQLNLNDGQPKSWWFSAEGLSEEHLASIEDTDNLFGGFEITPSATAACLRALRRHERDSKLAFDYIDNLVAHGQVCQVWPIDNFEIAWTLDFYRWAQSNAPSNKALIRMLAEQWDLQQGLGFSSAFPVSDGDSTAVAYTALHRAGLKPSDEPLMRFWCEGTFYGYRDGEYKSPVSAYVNALTAFRLHGNEEHKRAAMLITKWLRRQQLPLYDKWHISPFYPTSRLIPALVGFDDEFAQRCIESLLEYQQEDGGWGYRGTSTAEETSYAILGLIAAWRAGLLKNIKPFQKAKSYLANAAIYPTERLWIGKVLYQPIGVVRSAIDAARRVLESIEAEIHSMDNRVAVA